jgi:xyloglucan-specific exo-beta-1,4-glucanase
VVNPSTTGDVWVSTDAGLFHSTDSGSTFTAISGITQAWAIALGAPAKTGGYPAVFAAANIGGAVGYFRSDDTGANWVKINDASHGFGSASSNVLTADPRIYGRVYIGTNGRGIFYGDASGAAPPSSSTTSVRPTTSTTKATSSTTKAASTTTASHPITTSNHATTTSSAPASGSTQSVYEQCGGMLRCYKV